MAVTRHEIFFNKRSAHWVAVIIFDTAASMRCHLTKMGHKDSSHTDAACWQAHKPGKDRCVAELVFSRETINVSTVVHECTHAAYHHAVLVGVKFDDPDFQEWVCSDAGNLSDTLLALLDQQGEKIPMESVPTRRFITTRK